MPEKIERGERGEKGQDEENDQVQAQRPPSQEESPVCRPKFGKLSPCEKNLKAQDQPESDVKASITSPSNQLLPGKTLVFISLSMPETSLKSLAQEAERYQTILVLRGLVKDSFKETAQALQHLGLSAQINPEAFDLYRINQVPTFVWVDDNDRERACLKGNVTLAFAQQKFRDTL